MYVRFVWLTSRKSAREKKKREISFPFLVNHITSHWKCENQMGGWVNVKRFFRAVSFEFHHRSYWSPPDELVFMKFRFFCFFFSILPKSSSCSPKCERAFVVIRKIASNLMICDCYIFTIIDFTIILSLYLFSLPRYCSTNSNSTLGWLARLICCFFVLFSLILMLFYGRCVFYWNIIDVISIKGLKLMLPLA